MFFNLSSLYRKVSLLLLILLFSGLLTGCGRESAPTAVVQQPAIPKRPTPTALPLILTPEDLPSPTPVPMEPTVTPLASPSPLPNIDLITGELAGGGDMQPGITDWRPSITQAAAPLRPYIGDDEEDGVGSVVVGAALPAVELDSLPKLNGVPKLPVSNPQSSQLAAPPLKENYGANGKPRVGVQVGHWQAALLPSELAHLRTQTGGRGGGINEVDLVLDVARRVVSSLRAQGIEADLLPATVPPGYTADAFVAIHADANENSAPHGYKLARGRSSAIPTTDDRLMDAIYDSYGRATNFRRDQAITRNMTGYYAFSNRRRVYAISKVTPAVILELGYLTNPADLTFMLGNKDKLAQGIVGGVVNFLNTRPPLAQREKPISTVKGIEITRDDVPVYEAPGGKLLAYLAKGQQLETSLAEGNFYPAFIPALNKRGYVSRDDVSETSLPR